jgi:hypothetical protein
MMMVWLVVGALVWYELAVAEIINLFFFNTVV